MAIGNILRRVLVYGLLMFGVFTFFSAIITYECLRDYGPGQSNMETGHIYPMRMQQPFDVFLTKFEIEWLKYGPAIGVSIGFASAILNMRWNIIHNPYDDKPKKLF